MRELLSSYWWAIMVLMVALIFFMRNVRRDKRQ